MGYHVAVGKCPIRAQIPKIKNGGSAISGGTLPDMATQWIYLNYLQVGKTTIYNHIYKL
jgi:hypothetical protein